MQTIYTLITQAYCGTVTVQTLVTSFLDRTLAEEALKVVESVNEYSAFQVHCHIKESKLIETRDEVDLFNPEFFEQQKAEITKSGNEWRERKKIQPQLASEEEIERLNKLLPKIPTVVIKRRRK